MRSFTGLRIANIIGTIRSCSTVVTSTVREAQILSEINNTNNAPEVPTEPKEGAPVILPPQENVSIEFNKLRHEFSQEGPYLGSKMKDRDKHIVDQRERRAIVRVPQPEVEYIPNETSFRRLPKDCRMPGENELRALYPQSTGLEILRGEADCVDHSALGFDEDPAPIEFGMLAPPGWDRTKEYPYMVVLSDHRGIPRDFEDVCANFFERPTHRELMLEQQFVILCPTINTRHNFQIPVEGVVARFCDWVCETHNVENNRVHLFGKGNGGYLALRTVLENRDVALSVTALLGRSGTPFRPMDKAQEKVKNYNGVHSLVYVPGLMRKQDWHYKFKFMMDMARIRPALRNIHFADVKDHQLYYAVNPYEFWNHMRYFRQYNMRMLTETGHKL